MNHDLHIPQIIKHTSEFNTKDFQATLRNINLKLHCEFALVSITELVDIAHVKMVKVRGATNSYYFRITDFGSDSSSKGLDEKKLSLSLSYCTIYFEDSFRELKESVQKKVLNQVKTRCQNIRGSLRGLSVKWWENPLDESVSNAFKLKYPNGAIITHDIQTKNNFINDFLPNNWGDYRHTILEKEHFDNLLEESKTQQTTAKRKI